MAYYINCIKQHNSLNYSIKELIPQMNMRRRMSNAVKMGVTTGMESLLDFEAANGANANSNTLSVDAIISATTLGCIADSEKFLANVIEQNEQMINPTPFIQSTFNTVGAQIALIKGMHCYNNTFSHRYISLESALIDAMIRLDNEASNAVLVVFFDEATPTVEKILKRMNMLRERELGEGAFAFVLTAKRCESSVAEITSLQIGNVEAGKNSNENRDTLYLSKINNKYWYGGFGELLNNMVSTSCNSCTDNEPKDTSFRVINDIDGVTHSKIELLCI